MSGANYSVNMERRRCANYVAPSTFQISWSNVPDSWVALLLRHFSTKTVSAKFRLVCMDWRGKHDALLKCVKLRGDFGRVGSLLLKFPCLEYLDLSFSNNFSANGFDDLCSIPRIKSLDLSRTWEAIASHPQDVNNVLILKLSEILCASSLHTLNLRNCEAVSDRGIRNLYRISGLTSLDLTNCQKLTDMGMHNLGKVSALKTLQLNCCSNVSHIGLRALSRLSSLKTLFMGSCKNINTKSLKEIARISSLRILVLESCAGITDDGLEAVRSLSSLRSLNIASCVRISDKGMKLISAFPKLRSLDISYCYAITDEGVKAIASSTTLTTLRLVNCHLISRAGLLPLVGMPVLRRIVSSLR